MRAFVTSCFVIGVAALAGGAYAAVGAVAADTRVDQMGWVTWALCGFVLGGMLVFLGVRLRRLAPGRASAGASVAGYGTVLSVRDTGEVVGDVLAVLEAEVNVLAPGIAPFTTSTTVRVPRDQVAQVVPGAQLPIFVDRDGTEAWFDMGRSVLAPHAKQPAP